MKKFLLLLLILFCITDNLRAQESEVPEGYEYVPFVVEGKTWWCETDHWSTDGWVEHWYGVTIGGDTIVEDVTWKKCLLIDENRKLHTRPIILVREENKCVYTHDVYYDEPFYKFPDYVDEALKCNNHTSLTDMLIYDFNLNVGDMMTRGHWQSNELVETVSYVENAGVIFKVYNNEIVPDDFTDAGTCLGLYEGIGEFMDNIFFITPLMDRLACTFPKYYYLAWVTNPDNTLLFEAWGGPKLWEQEGVTDAVDAPLQIVNSGRCITVGGVAEAAVTVTDMAGTTVLRDVIPAGTPLPLTHLAPGVYIIHATTPTGHTATKKVVL